jgi:N6-adenosine-specific RNA methylase IME4
VLRYRTIVADPPWAYEAFGGYNQAGRNSTRVWVERPLPYFSLAVDEIAALPVGRFADPNGTNLFCWTTNRYLPESFAVLQGWGARYRQILVWHKTGANPNTGAVAPTSCEFLLYARFGKGVALKGKLPDAMVETKRQANRHSAKPEAFLDLIEQVSPGPYLELFARRQRLGWDTWGDEALEHVAL